MKRIFWKLFSNDFFDHWLRICKSKCDHIFFNNFNVFPDILILQILSIFMNSNFFQKHFSARRARENTSPRKRAYFQILQKLFPTKVFCSNLKYGHRKNVWIYRLVKLVVFSYKKRLKNFSIILIHVILGQTLIKYIWKYSEDILIATKIFLVGGFYGVSTYFYYYAYIGHRNCYF